MINTIGKNMATAALALLALPAGATTVWDESVSGDLSSDPLAPTALGFGVGVNSISGTVTAAGDTRDYITFSIAPGTRLTGITLTSWFDVGSGGTGNRGFAHLDDGSTSVVPSGATALEFLGGAHVDTVDIGADFLAILAAAAQGGTGFATPLSPGDYTFNIQQTSAILTGYSLDFEVSAVPVPGAVWLLASGLLGLAGLRRSR